MHWKLKANIQNAVSLLPSSISYATYYWLQRQFGNLRIMNPVSRLTAGIETWKRIKKLGYEPRGKVFLEVGTGRAPIVPIAYWLMGAQSTVTIDRNPYLKAELVKECLQYISDNCQEIEKIFGLLLERRRLDDLLRISRCVNFNMGSFLDLCNIQYIAPGDATQTELSPKSINFHTSWAVFEHIPPAVLKRIIDEGNRIITDDGLFVNNIDYSDHFSHSDSTIPPINFLQYSDDEWDKYAGNRYMYMNRLRHDDFISLFQQTGHRILVTEPTVHQQSLELLRSGSLKVNERFKNKSKEVLATTGSWIVSQNCG